MTSVLEDPRVQAVPARSASTNPDAQDYLIDGPVIGYRIKFVDAGWNGDLPGGWVVMNGYSVWLGIRPDHPHVKMRPQLAETGGVDAKAVYSSAEDAVGAVLAGLDAR